MLFRSFNRPSTGMLSFAIEFSHVFRPIEMVGVTGVEPVTSSLSGMRSNQLSYTPACKANDLKFDISDLKSLPPRESGGGKRDRTDDLLNANQALSQLSYTPSVVLSFVERLIECLESGVQGLR